jgi:hypothetical protein
MFNTTATQMTSEQDLIDIGVNTDILNFGSNTRLNWKNITIDNSYLRNDTTYATVDNNSGLILLFYSTTGEFAPNEIISSSYPVLLYDPVKQVMFYIKTNFTTSVASNIDSLMPINDCSFTATHYSPIPNIYPNKRMINLNGSNQYMYSHMSTFDGIESDKVIGLYGISSGTTNPSIWNTDITLDDGTIITPIYNNNADSTTSSYIWICANKDA